MSRSFLVGPVICTLVGIGVGVCVGMVSHQDVNERARVYIGDSLPLASWGALAGSVVGGCVYALARNWPGLLPILTMVMATALGTVMVAPIGWIYGDLLVRRARPGMLIGAVVGTIIGFLIGVRQGMHDRRQLSTSSSTPERGASNR